jgi:hypothetical protein
MALVLSLMGFNRATDDATPVGDDTKRIVDQFGGAIMLANGDYLVWG